MLTQAHVHKSLPSVRSRTVTLVAVALTAIFGLPAVATPATPIQNTIDFNRDIRPILSNRCFACHGPDEATIEAGLRLDSLEHASAPADSGLSAIVPNNSTDSELLKRVKSADEGERMPPASLGAGLEPREIELLEQWIEQGATYAQHWAFAPLSVSTIEWKTVTDPNFENWNHSPIDRMLWSRLQDRGWSPNFPADKRTILRRLYLDMIGLPPTPEELLSFEQDTAPDAYEQRVDQLLSSPSFGEHWGRKWLDIARYADSAGYADDPLRTIWGYRDWVINSINQGMPFDQFTIEQIAGDLLKDATPEQQIATAFHRNTMTNNEGGTNDEEFRNVAVVDRVNTTFSAWLGLTMACAQCHSHKYDPISHEDYFKLFAIFNQTQDADRSDESPVLDWFTPEQRALRTHLESELREIHRRLDEPFPLQHEEARWLAEMQLPIEWSEPRTKSTEIDSVADKDRFQISWVVDTPQEIGRLKAIRLETSPYHAPAAEVAKEEDATTVATASNFVLTDVTLESRPSTPFPLNARYLRIELTGASKMISLAEVEVFKGTENVAVQGKASQSTTDFGGDAGRAIDGNRDGNYENNSVSHTAVTDAPWWELDLLAETSLDSVVIWNRTDGNLQSRLNGALVTLLDSNRNVVCQEVLNEAQSENRLTLDRNQKIHLRSAKASFSQPGFPAADSIDTNPASGWAVAGREAESNFIEFAIDGESLQTVTGKLDFPAELKLTLTFQSQQAKQAIREFKLSVSEDPRYEKRGEIPEDILHVVQLDEVDRSVEEQERLHRYFVAEISSHNQANRELRLSLQNRIRDLKAYARVPVMQELEPENRRETFIQLRGNYREHGPRVEAGLPGFLHISNRSLSKSEAQSSTVTSRLDLAQWIVRPDNPLTPRVIANRFWEEIFGTGIVSTSEDFGSQGTLPTHPELLDFLATDLIRNDWDTKRFLRVIVLSQAYRQSSRATASDYERDPDNSYVSRGPRVRPAAEVVRDATLASSGLLANRMLGPSVQPMQPNLGLNTAFGGKTDWETSQGENRYRRATYTQWRRSSPYSSMATFDAPNREVCTLKRDRTNTPLQALVTLNDPTYLEAAQNLARRLVVYEHADAPDNLKLEMAFLSTVGRSPQPEESRVLIELLEQAKSQLRDRIPDALKLATVPIGPLPNMESANAQASTDNLVIDLAAWTSICNVLLNLDEFLVKL